MRLVLKLAGIVVLAFVGIVAIAIVFLRTADGPTGPIQGGVLRNGTLVTDANVDWARVMGEQPVNEIELQLVTPPGSRVTGAFVHDGELYVPCDLGFIWRRVPEDGTRGLLHLIWLLKDWHHDAVSDGRVVVRVAGNRYERQAVRVTDPELLETFRSLVENAAAEYFGGSLLETPADPEAIWFFRLDPRLTGG